jgi:hypothetical protein
MDWDCGSNFFIDIKRTSDWKGLEVIAQTPGKQARLKVNLSMSLIKHHAMKTCKTYKYTSKHA